MNEIRTGTIVVAHRELEQSNRVFFVKSTVSEVFEDLKFISEGYKQN